MNPTQNLTIYYFSGTGNSKNVAGWISSVASKYNIVSEIINIANIDRLSIAPPPPGALVVFVSPIHGFNYPPVMLHFIARFPKGKNKIILMCTRAGMLIGKSIVPGLTGAAFLLSAFILKLKGYSITGMVPVDLPSNWISLHPGLNEKTVKYLHEKNKEKVIAYAELIISQKTCFIAMHENILNIIISPIAILYYLVGRFIFAKSFYTSSDCNQCDLCIKNCPVKAIVKIDKRPFWTFNCESCMHCMNYCPQKSIETAHGFIIGYIFYSSVLTGLFLNYFNQWFFSIDNGFIRYVVETLLFLLILGIFYRIIHYLMRFKWVERLMVFTSLTELSILGKTLQSIKEFLMQEKTKTYYQNKVEEVLTYITQHLGDNLNVKELAERFGISFFHFHRILKAAINEPLGSYIDRVRLETAISLIRYSNDQITSIAIQIGYSDLSSFSKAFSKEFGISPQEFKANKEIVLNTHVDYRINDCGAIITDLKPKIVFLPEKSVVFIRIVGIYGGEEVIKAWDDLLGFAVKNKLLNWNPDLFAIYYNDPELIGPENCTGDYCIAMKKPIELPLQFNKQIIKGGKYAVFRYRGPYENLWELYYSIYRNWVLFTDMKLSNSPTIERYVNYSNNTKPENLVTDIYIPIE